ncbi:MAG: ribonuclease Z [Amphritea sp.]
MEILFLGTSSGTPTKRRNVSAVAVKKANCKRWYLIDCGEGTQQQLLRTKLTLNNLQAIFITHVHGDHCYGLPGLLASAGMSGRVAPLTIVAPAGIQEFVEVTQRVSQLQLPYQVEFVRVENSSTELFRDHDFTVESVALSHRVPSFAYGFSEAWMPRKLNIAKLHEGGIEAGPDWGRIHKGENIVLADGRVINAADYLLETRLPRKIIVAGDNDTPELLSDCVKAANVLVHEATYTQGVAEKVGLEHQHSSAKAVAQFAESVMLDNLVLTHFSPRYQDIAEHSPSITDIENEARIAYRGNLFLANDFETFKLDRDGRLSKVSDA